MGNELDWKKARAAAGLLEFMGLILCVRLQTVNDLILTIIS
jgi:hypothetical protein